MNAVMMDCFRRLRRGVALVAVASCCVGAKVIVEAALPVASLDRSSPVSFEREILPVLQANCLACHNATKAKADLNLETPTLIRQGGDSGASVVPGDPEQSLLFIAASHKDEDMIMPPVGNKSNARPFNPEELALLALWIRQGAEGEVRKQETLDWTPLSDRIRSIYATALTETGRFVAFGRGSDAIVHELTTEGSRSRLIDPQLGGERAHLDSVNAIAISAGGDLVASGGFREVKLWRRSLIGDAFTFFSDEGFNPPALALSSDGLLAVFGYENRIVVREISTGRTIFSQETDPGSLKGVNLSGRNDALLALTAEKEASIIEIQSERTVSIALPDVAVSSLPLGDGFALAFRNGTLGMLTRSGESVWHLEPIANLSGVATMTADAHGNSMVAGTEGGEVWLVNTPENSARMLFRREQAPGVLALNRGLKLLLVGTGDGRVEVCELETGKSVTELQGARLQRQQLGAVEKELGLRLTALKVARATLKQDEKEASKAVERLNQAKQDAAEKKQKFQEFENSLAKAKQGVTDTEQERKLVDEALKQAVAKLDAARGLLNEARRKLEAAARKEGSSDSASVALKEALNEVEGRAIEFGKLEAGLVDLRNSTEKKRAALDEQLKAAKNSVKEAEKKAKETEKVFSLAKVELELSEDAVEGSEQSVQTSKGTIVRLEKVVDEAKVLLEEAKLVLAGARQPFVSLFFGESGERIFGVEENGAINVWSVSQGTELDYVPGFGDRPLKVWALTSNTLARIESTGTCSLIQLDAGWKLVKRWGRDAGFSDRVMALDFSPDGKLLAAGGGDPSRSGNIKIWDVVSHERIHDFPAVHSDVVFALKFSPDGRQLASGGADRFARVIDLESGRVRHHLEGHTHYVMDVDWTQDGRLLASAGADGVAKLWDTVSGERTKNIEGFDKELTGVAFVGAGNEVLVSSGDKTMVLFGSDGKRLRALDKGAEFLLNAAISRNGRWAAAGSHHGVLTLWEIASGNIFRQVR